MKTRRGLTYPILSRKRDRCQSREKHTTGSKRRRVTATEWAAGESRPGFFDDLPDDIVLSILCKLSSSAVSPADLINILITCKRLNELGRQPVVLSKASTKALAVRATIWSASAHDFLKRCADAGNLEASYTLGMIQFYCLASRKSGALLMAKAAMGSHAAALYSLAVIQFNGSGGSKSNKNLRAGVALCARAATLGHVDALRELGHSLQDGYGVRQNAVEGRRFLVQANARELAGVLRSAGRKLTAFRPDKQMAGALMSDFGCNVPAPEVHPANRFMAEWFAERPAGDGLRMCSNDGCGRPETRRHEFRRCSVCGAVNYCSRACQALHWKLAHKAECTPMEHWIGAGAGAGAGEVAGGEN